MQRSFWWLGLVFMLHASPAAAWNRDRAFTYLEARQHAWADWKPAQKADGPCMSCHTGVSYLIAQRERGTPLSPEQRRVVDAARARVRTTPPTVTLPDPGAEVVLNLFALAFERRASASPKAPPSEAERSALGHLWAAQIRTGAARGSWTWVDADLEPMDSTRAVYLGTAYAAMALAVYPDQPADRVAEMYEYFARAASDQPLHHRLAWAAAAHGAGRGEPAGVLAALWKVQDADGGWPTAALGPWSPHPDAPRDRGSNAYATAWAAWTAHAAGVACSEPRLARALDWLDRHQDRATGAWPAPSLNKVYADGSIQRGFMTDAATGFATAALVACGR